MAEILPPEHTKVTSSSRWESPQWKRARPLVIGVSVAGCFGFILWGFNEFTSLRGVIHVLASRIVLVGMWVAGVLIAVLITWGARLRRKRTAVFLCAIAWAAILYALDWWAPKPSTAGGPPPRTAPLITLKIHPTAFPVSVPPRTTLHILPLHPFQTFTDAASQLHEYDNECSTDRPWPSAKEISSKPANSYEEVRSLEVVNHGPGTLESGRLVFGVRYNQSTAGGCTAPPLSAQTQDDVISIPTLDQGQGFGFVSVNQTNGCTWLLPPDTIRIKMVGDDNAAEVPLKIEPISVPNWISTPFGPTAVRWEGVPAKNPGYGMVRSGADCQTVPRAPAPPRQPGSAELEKAKRKKVRDQIAAFIGQGLEIKGECERLDTSEQQL